MLAQASLQAGLLSDPGSNVNSESLMKQPWGAAGSAAWFVLRGYETAQMLRLESSEHLVCRVGNRQLDVATLSREVVRLRRWRSRSGCLADSARCAIEARSCERRRSRVVIRYVAARSRHMADLASPPSPSTARAMRAARPGVDYLGLPRGSAGGKYSRRNVKLMRASDTARCFGTP